ncbi:sugar ABC transporter ATP-binding protein [Treponema phagedenis]|uniref:ABC transporter, ATP-binding protein n=1 Tax=Treponema phagedenis TaxID=162 RepID=A0A0B7GYK8_TREPH|nr:sugar ABC transporter ATP-binding protein [Treponema phagedenis]NVP25153.1 sugar ABC transporter ATP-binding protein [Treponema phagedenis]QEJ96029.1 sugar ABC transporter ATP-binding protein [Treponema phagedenis]QEJ97267.1 sugar ABC transporter ATP-binding protein [Treponema phagedenis]QEK01793.1 sugar ABC transporter ATP-binding protein [Treponema phagedenis]QEK02540.1 sugar ABC transporter ATP-binding protein [Treponema phagedenis]
MSRDTTILSLDNVTKEFSGTQVLEGVTFDLHEGEILGLVGENGAGKTTLMSILFGMPVIAETGGYGGRIIIDHKEIKFKSPLDALDAGIGMVHQEFSLIPGFSAAENIMLNREIKKPSLLSDIFGERLSLLNRAAMRERAQKAIDQLGVQIDARTHVSEMPVGHKQFTEIAREIDRENVRILVLDEPTAVLTESEAKILLESIKKLAAKGIAIIFISHRLQEVMDICDRVVTLRDGKSIKDIPIAETSIKEIAASMVGRDIKKAVKDTEEKDFGQVLFDVKNLWVDMPGEVVRDVSFSVRQGEIFGIGGLAGQGKVGILNGIMGLFTCGGTVTFEGKELELNNTKKILEQGIAFVSEDRRGVGLLLDETLEWNIAFTAMQVKDEYLINLFGKLIKVRDDRAMQKLAEKYVDMLQIKCTSTKQKAKELSGGNQQKICLAKAFCMNPKILFVAEPTRGIDVGAKTLVLDALRKLNKEEGTTIIIVSSELEELRSVCDRIGIVFQGKMAGILSPKEEPAEFALYMAGVK